MQSEGVAFIRNGQGRPFWKGNICAETGRNRGSELRVEEQHVQRPPVPDACEHTREPEGLGGRR